jgi:hypothetical protein
VTNTPVILILSTPHAGSHLLSQLLGAHSLCISTGELHNYKKFSDRPKERNVIDNYSKDPIFADLDQLPISSWHASILKHARQGNPELTTLVDNSKRVEWCARLRQITDVDVRPIHLIRDPRALVRYWFRTYTDSRRVRQQRIRHARMAPMSAFHLLTCPELDLYIGKWLIRNKAITDMLQKMQCSHHVVSYHDLATQTSVALPLIMEFLNLTYERSQLDYGRVEQHGTLKREYKRATEASQITFDTRWDQDLDSEQIDYISNHQSIAEYLESINMRLGRRGITRK